MTDGEIVLYVASVMRNRYTHLRVRADGSSIICIYGFVIVSICILPCFRWLASYGYRIGSHDAIGKEFGMQEAIQACSHVYHDDMNIADSSF